MKELELYRRTKWGYEPCSGLAVKAWEKSKNGNIDELRRQSSRNPGQHNKFFAMLALVVHNSERFNSVDHLRFAIMAALQRGEWVETPGAEKVMFIPDSIAFDKMRQDDFEILYNDAMNVIMKYFLPVDRQDLQEMIAMA